MQLAFPFKVKSGSAASAPRDRYVSELIEQILLTEAGQRVNRPAFGAGVRYLVFEPQNSQSTATVQHLVQTALVTNLPHDLATVQNVAIEAVQGQLKITVDYTLVPDQQRGRAIVYSPGSAG